MVVVPSLALVAGLKTTAAGSLQGPSCSSLYCRASWSAPRSGSRSVVRTGPTRSGWRWLSSPTFCVWGSKHRTTAEGRPGSFPEGAPSVSVRSRQTALCYMCVSRPCAPRGRAGSGNKAADLRAHRTTPCLATGSYLSQPPTACLVGPGRSVRHEVGPAAKGADRICTHHQPRAMDLPVPPPSIERLFTCASRSASRLMPRSDTRLPATSGL